MTDRPLSLVTTAPVVEPPREHVANAIQILVKARAEAFAVPGTTEVIVDVDAALVRLRTALEDLRHQLIVQPIREDPYGEPVRILEPAHGCGELDGED